MVLHDRTYVLSDDAIKALRQARIAFSEVSREGELSSLEEVAGERV
jgi:hypothetical protein